MEAVSFQKNENYPHFWFFFSILHFLLYGIFFNKYQQVVGLRKIIIYI